MYDLKRFALKDMTTLGAALRNMGQGAQNMEEVAQRIIRHLYDNFVDAQSGEKNCVLVRFFKTHPYGKLDAQLGEFARNVLGGQSLSDEVKCLTLLATAGEKPEWHERRSSTGHQAIPLPSETVVNQIPMISQLIRQFGLEVSDVLEPSQQLILDLAQTSFNVFLVPDAVGSPYVPAQEEFVIPFGVKSVLGLGGMLPSGDLFVIILFSKAVVNRETANMFKSLALNIKMAVLPFWGGRIFA